MKDNMLKAQLYQELWESCEDPDDIKRIKKVQELAMKIGCYNYLFN